VIWIVVSRDEKQCDTFKETKNNSVCVLPRIINDATREIKMRILDCMRAEQKSD
jgi:hypothetical protein